MVNIIENCQLPTEDMPNKLSATDNDKQNVSENGNPTTQMKLIDQQTDGEAKQADKGDEDLKKLGIADILGEFGFYQISLSLLAFVRYVCVAMMNNTGPLIAPTIDYSCELPNSIEPLVDKGNLTLADYLKGKCSVELINGTKFECSKWSYSDKFGITLTDTFDLVCERDWLRSAFQSTVSVGVVVASVLWGFFSDKYGRSFTMKVCYVISLVFGLISYYAQQFIIYAITRAICSMGDIGLVVSIATIIVETLGNKYRGAVCIIIYTGWAIGVMMMPWITEYFGNFRQLMLFTVSCHILTLPWILTIGESVRWLLVNGQIQEASCEVKRICKWNCTSGSDLGETMEKFDKFKIKFEILAERNKLMKEARPPDTRCSSLIAGLSKIGQLFKTKELTITTFTVIWTTFNSELLYMLFIMMNSDIGDNVKLNYIIGGIMEVLATLISIAMTSGLTRKFSLTATLIIISTFCLCLAFTHEQRNVSIWTLNIAKLAISTLSSLIYVVTTEIFPTNLRQTGVGLTATLGSFGGVVAPFIRQLAEMIGMTYVMLILFFFPLSAAVIIPFHLRETKGVELADDIDDIDAGGYDLMDANGHQRRDSSASRQNKDLPTVVSL